MSRDDTQDAPPSIASLRSKFESLAAAQKGLRERAASPIRPKPAVAVPLQGQSNARIDAGAGGRTNGVDDGGLSASGTASDARDDRTKPIGEAVQPRSRSPLPLSDPPTARPVNVKVTTPSPTPPEVLPVSQNPIPSDNEEEVGLSVRALKERFNSPTPVLGVPRTHSTVSSRAPSPVPTISRSSPVPITRPQSTSTLAHMTQRLPLPASGSQTPVLGGSLTPRASSERSNEGGMLAISPQALSMLSPALHREPDGAMPEPGPIGGAEASMGRKPAPPPPASRASASSNAGQQPQATSQEHRKPPPPPAPSSRSTAVDPPIATTSLSRASTVRAAPSAPPTLPARKQSLPPDVNLPPPIPSGRPTAPLGSSLPKPSLPTRPRGETVTQGTNVAPPILPARSDTAPADLPPPPTRTAEASSGAGLTRRITRKAVPQDQARRDSAPLVRRQSVQVPPDDGYQPPPPPTRSGAPVVAIPPRQNSKEADSDDDEPDEPAPGLTSNAKRLLDDYPDSTHANRRPPSFVPDIKISGTSHTTAFAAHGRHVCTGTHCVKVYDTLMSDQPLFVVDLKETGLDFRVKENRVTAMCFRPANNPADEGRYLWCGTKDGHLWELDIKTGDITDTRAFVHSSAVSHIFRYKTWIMSLEEGGKLHVFQVQENRRIPQCRTIRVQERFTFARLIGGRLWTSTGPATRSTTTASASRGPTIRVYDPCAPGTTLSAGTTVWPSEWTGAVTSATCMPMHPGIVYLGHEGGYVSVWDADQLVCQQVFKISANDILALEGVGERLWAAGRKGMISVYDVSERPWRTTNVWTAHIEFAIHELVVDPYSVQDTGRFILWSLAKDGLRAWDGLLSVDWVDQQMTAKQERYCSFRQIKALVCSWNIDSARPNELSGSEENVHFFPQLLSTVDRPEILIFGFQEVIPLTDKKLTAKTLLFGGKDKDSDKISGAYRQWVDKLQMAVYNAYPDTPYVKVHSENMVGLLTCVFVKADERDILRDVDVCTVKRGIGGIYGNKGAIVARLVIDDTSLCFINVHLAAGQSAKASRTADLAAIMEDKAVFPPSDALPYIRGGDGTAISDHELVILNGDLNYRIDQRRENVLASISAGDLDYLLEHDQLRKEMRNNHAFRLRSFDEAPITFQPTYKYNPGQTSYDSSEKNRIPAWCDRILYSKTDRIQNLHYQRYETTVSDHRPISAAYALTVKAVNWEKMKAVREEVRGEWAKREADVLERIEKAYVDLL